MSEYRSSLTPSRPQSQSLYQRINEVKVHSATKGESVSSIKRLLTDANRVLQSTQLPPSSYQALLDAEIQNLSNTPLAPKDTDVIIGQYRPGSAGLLQRTQTRVKTTSLAEQTPSKRDLGSFPTQDLMASPSFLSALPPLSARSKVKDQRDAIGGAVIPDEETLVPSRVSRAPAKLSSTSLSANTPHIRSPLVSDASLSGFPSSTPSLPLTLTTSRPTAVPHQYHSPMHVRALGMESPRVLAAAAPMSSSVSAGVLSTTTSTTTLAPQPFDTLSVSELQAQQEKILRTLEHSGVLRSRERYEARRARMQREREQQYHQALGRTGEEAEEEGETCFSDNTGMSAVAAGRHAQSTRAARASGGSGCGGDARDKGRGVRKTVIPTVEEEEEEEEEKAEEKDGGEGEGGSAHRSRTRPSSASTQQAAATGADVGTNARDSASTGLGTGVSDCPGVCVEAEDDLTGVKMRLDFHGLRGGSTAAEQAVDPLPSPASELRSTSTPTSTSTSTSAPHAHSQSPRTSTHIGARSTHRFYPAETFTSPTRPGAARGGADVLQTARMDDIVAESTTLKTEIARVQTELKIAQEESRSRHKELLLLEQALLDTRHELSKAEQQLRAVTLQMDEVHTVSEGRLHDLQQLEVEMDEARAKAEEERRALREQLQAAETHVEVEKTKKSELLLALNDTQGKLHTLRGQYESVSKEHALLLPQLKQGEEDIAHKRQEIHDLTNTLTVTQGQLRAAVEEAAALKEEIQATTAELAEAREQAMALGELKCSLEARLEVQAAALQSAEVSVARREEEGVHQLRLKDDQIRNLSSELDRAKTSAYERGLELEDVRGRLGMMAAREGEMTGTLSRARKEINKLRADIAVLQQQADAKEALGLQLDIVMREKEVLVERNQEIEPLKKKLERVQFEKEELLDRITALKRDRERGAKEVESCHETITELRNRVLELTRENDELTNRTHRMEDIVNHYTENMNEAKQKNEELAEKLRAHKDLLVSVGEKLENRIQQCDALEVKVAALTNDLDSAMATHAQAQEEWEAQQRSLQSALDAATATVETVTKENVEIKDGLSRIPPLETALARLHGELEATTAREKEKERERDSERRKRELLETQAAAYAQDIEKLSTRASALDKLLLQERQANKQLNEQVASMQQQHENERAERQAKEQAQEETVKGMASHVKALEAALATARSQLAQFIGSSAISPRNGGFGKRSFRD